MTQTQSVCVPSKMYVRPNRLQKSLFTEFSSILSLATNAFRSMSLYHSVVGTLDLEWSIYSRGVHYFQFKSIGYKSKINNYGQCSHRPDVSLKMKNQCAQSTNSQTYSLTNQSWPLRYNPINLCLSSTSTTTRSFNISQ